MTLSRTLYETIPGSPTSKLTQAYFSGVSENIIIENGNIVPDAPNIITVITDDKSHFATVRYDTKRDNVLSDLTVLRGSGIMFDADTTIAVRNYTYEDDSAIKQNITENEQRVSNLESSRIVGVKIAGTELEKDANNKVNIPIGGSGLGVSKSGTEAVITPDGSIDISIATTRLEGLIDAVTANLTGHAADKTNPHAVTKSQIGLGNADNTADLDKPISDATQEALDLKADDADLSAHVTDTSNPHEVTKAQVGLGNVNNTSDLLKPISTATQAALDLKADDADLSEHVADTENPHGVTKAQVGLGNADNTSDEDKPISTAAQAALDLKADDSDLSAHVEDTDNPHSVTKAQVGLGNADNTSDTDKPISDATQAALDEKVDKVEGKGLSSNDYTSAEKSKLAGIASGAEVNVQADWNESDSADDAYIKNKPQSLKNPNAIIFTGAVSSQYDGSAEVTVNIPDSAVWGNITGDIEDQEDISSELAAKQNVIDASHKLSADLVSETATKKFNVQSDWNATTGDAVILNKPAALPPAEHAATHESGGSDEISVSESQVTGLVEDLAGKADTEDVPTALSQLTEDATHRLVTDANKSAWNAKQDALTFDNTPTSGSSNPVTSGGVYASVSGVAADLESHEGDTDNPHSVTAAQVGLGNVNNTSDLLKPISTATQEALNLKADDADLSAHVEDTDNPHSVTKAQVGLGDTENGAQINVIESIKKNGVAQTIVNKEIDLVLSKSDVGLGNVDNTSDSAKVSTSGNPIHDALDGKVSGFIINGTELAKDANKKSSLNFGLGLTYDAATATVKTAPPDFPVYGFQIDESNSDPSAAVTRIGDAITDADAMEVFKKYIRPCVVKNAIRQFYVSDTDWSKREDGSSSGVLNGVSLDGDFMNEYPTFWFKVSTISANVHQVEFAWSKTGGVGWVTPHVYDGKLINNIYGGVYEAYENNGILRSIHSTSLQPTVSKTNQAFRNSAQNSARGSNASRYTIDMPLIYMMKLILKIWLYKTLDFQTKVARGIVDDGSSVVGRRPLAYQMATSGSNLITQGTPASSQQYTDNKAAVVAREVNPYGNVWKHWVGCAYRYNELAIALDGHDTVDVTSITVSNWDAKTKDWHLVKNWSTVNGYVKAMTWDNAFPFAPKTSSGGSATTYYSDYTYRNGDDSPTSRTPRCCRAGADWNHGSYAGPFCLYVNNAVGYSGSYVGARLHCFGLE